MTFSWLNINKPNNNKDMKETKIEILKITPEIASEWLQDKWGDQRSVRNGHVERLISDMIAGRFHLSPDAILRVKGKLANGQHRLAAVVACGKAQWFLVMHSDDEELYKVVDAGIKRTDADGLIGVEHAKLLPPIARWVMLYDSGITNQTCRSLNATRSEIIDYCNSNRTGLQKAAAYVGPLYTETQLLPASIGGAIYFLGERIGKCKDGEEFLTGLYKTGTGAAGDLRNRLIANKGSRSRLSPLYIFGITIKAFNSHLKGTRLGVIKWLEGEKLPELAEAA